MLLIMPVCNFNITFKTEFWHVSVQHLWSPWMIGVPDNQSLARDVRALFVECLD
jgi:hypothetical protein